jgi:hypothetical protein
VKVVRIPKGNGKFRTVYCPDPAEKAALVRLVPSLTAAAVQADRSCVCHAFMPGRSPVTNAMQHRGHRFTLSFDLKDFFDTVNRELFIGDVIGGERGKFIFSPEYDACFVDGQTARIFMPGQRVYYIHRPSGKREEGIVKSRHPSFNAYFVVYACNGDWKNYQNYKAALTDQADLTSDSTAQGYARQGLPTSPMIANMAAAPMDEALLALSARSGRFDNSFVYTRYADDLCFSFDDARIAVMLKNRVPEIVKAHGFILNESKTKMQCAAAGRRIICGIAVDDECHPTRHMKRRYRASVHRNNRPQMHGLAEWLRLRPPRRWSYDEAIRQNNAKGAAILLRRPTIVIGGIRTQDAQPVRESPVAAVIGWARRKFDL